MFIEYNSDIINKFKLLTQKLLLYKNNKIIYNKIINNNNYEKYFNTITDITKQVFKNDKIININNIDLDILDSNKLKKYLLISLKIKHLQMKYGLLWQKIFGAFDNFEDLNIGHYTGLDIISYDRKIIIELKNKYNTDNSSSKKTNLDKLSLFKTKNPAYTPVYDVINEKNKIGKFKIIKHNNNDIYYYSGDKLFELIYGNNYKFIVNNILSIIKNIISTYYILD